MACPRKSKKETHWRRDEDQNLTYHGRKSCPGSSKLELMVNVVEKKMNGSPYHTKNFGDLPYELCANIYFQLLRPDAYSYERATDCWQNALGRTKVLTLKKKIYAEALPILHNVAPPELKFHGHALNIFRHPLATGTPNLFSSYSRETSCYIPPFLTELSVMRLKKLTVSLRYPSKQSGRWIDDPTPEFIEDGQEKLAVLQKNFAQLHTAVAKSKDLVQLHFKTGFEMEGAKPITNDDIQEMMDVFRPFLVTASRNRFGITAEKDIVFKHGPYEGRYCFEIVEEYDDLLVRFLNNTAVVGYAGIAPQPSLPHTINIKAEDNGNPPGRYTQKVKAYDHTKYVPRVYKLVPECRQCYAVFRESIELQNHLNANPKHRIPFRKKWYNPTSRSAIPVSFQYKCSDLCGDLPS